MIISREFLMSNVTALEPVEVECPEWGGTVLVERALAKKQNDYAELVERMDKLNPNIGLVITFCVDENGKNLFTEADAAAFRKALPDAEAHVLHTAAHFPQETHSRAVCDYLRGWLKFIDD